MMQSLPGGRSGRRMKTVVSTDGSLGQSNPAGGEDDGMVDDGMLDNDDGMVDDGMTVMKTAWLTIHGRRRVQR